MGADVEMKDEGKKKEEEKTDKKEAPAPPKEMDVLEMVSCE